MVCIKKAKDNENEISDTHGHTHTHLCIVTQKVPGGKFDPETFGHCLDHKLEAG